MQVVSVVIVVIYTMAFIFGFIGVLMMGLQLYKTNILLMTATTFINLLLVHSLFLLTIPFRLVYYTQNNIWTFGYTFCEVVSGMIHIHMYMSFIFYVVILGIRYFSFFKENDNIEFNRKLHAAVASIIVWILIIAVIFPNFYIVYGTSTSYNETKCFQFQKDLEKEEMRTINYAITGFILTIVCILLTLQISIIIKVVKNIEGSVFTHQEFWVQMKSLVFILIMIVCFCPSLAFRLFYLKYTEECNGYNEILWSVSALSCVDLLLFSLKPFCHSVSVNCWF
ncbi:probable G-protein coupled receptor 141 [Spea bombifrons]|uniref:probable G-protein coupled receptor 141 n=1 Tax=Spea bombifrons TaxID=233779 RepID=UPI00234A0AEB|nr:probable G-protein coupled receptor 141 [Spea bombifrons]